MALTNEEKLLIVSVDGLKSALLELKTSLIDTKAASTDIPTTLPASDVSAWAKAASKPDYAYSEIGYTVETQSTSGAVSIDGTKPLHIITCTGNISGVTLSSNPPAGHCCHVIFYATAARTVAIAHDSTNRICPEAKALSLSIVANGYVEVDFLSVDNKVFVRGV